MSVPPKRTLLVLDFESVSVALSWTDWTLCYVLWTISPRIPQLSYSMPIPKNRAKKQSIKTENITYDCWKLMIKSFKLPMNTNVVTGSVDDSDCERVTVPDYKCWTRKLTVHSDALVSSAQPLHWSRLDLKVIVV